MIKELFNYKITPWWNSKMVFLFALAYLHFYLQEISFSNAVFFLFAFIISGFFVGLTGHLINDWFDFKQDKKALKFNCRNYLGNSKTIALIIFSVFISYLPWLLLSEKWIMTLFISLSYLIFLLYSVPTIRLKERKFLGVMSDVLYAYIIPVLMIFSFKNNKADGIQLIQISIIIWVSLVGIQQIVIHQLHDIKNDILSKTSTWAVYSGEKKTRSMLFNFFIPLQFLSFCMCIWLVDKEVSSLYLVLLITLFLYQIISIYIFKKRKQFIASKILADLQLSNVSYNSFFPYLNLLLVISFNFQFAILLFIHILIFDYLFLKFVYHRLLPTLRKPISFLINYTIYYSRRFILFESEEKAMREYYEDYLIRKRQKDTENKYSNIALLNINENKYTETFVLNHAISLRNEGYAVHELFGYPIPIKSIQNGFLSSNTIVTIKFLKFWNEFLFRENLYYRKKQFKRYLVKHNIELVLIEFGTCAVETYEICKDLNIPIIVFFYGYDIHHKNVLEENKERYKSLFSYASLLIGVSREIVLKLETLGADSKKTFYLPCALNFDLFTNSYNPKNDLTFLSVGRFTETKSPHLVILAFNEVLKKLPEAELRMVGKDGGGELFEACHILVKALGIEKNVQFLGVLSPEKVQEEMISANVFIQHSLTTPLHQDKEGTPVSIMEAMATGMPIISTKHAGILDLIESEVNGILVEEYDYLEMATQMIRIIQSKELQYYLGTNAAQSIRNNRLIVNNSTILASLIEEHKRI